MEFILGHLLQAIIEGIDGLFVKSLQRAVPELDQLMEDPQQVLDQRDILIGPRRQYFSRFLIGLAIACFGLGPCFLVLSIIEDQQPRRTLSPAIWLGTLISVGLMCFSFGFRLFRGGYCVLRDDGVKFTYRKRVVHCSWEVFNAPGRPMHIKESNLFLLPICPEATDLVVEWNKNETAVRNTGLDVATPQWNTHSHTEAAIKPLYVVKIEDMGNLLLRIGRKLGKRSPRPKKPNELSGRFVKPESQRASQSNPVTRQSSDIGHKETLLPWENPVFPVAHRENNGWIRMSLTTFYLPNYCCFCTVSARNTFLFNIPNKADSGSYPLNLYTCDRCCAEFLRRKRNPKLIAIRTALGFVPAIVVLFREKPSVPCSYDSLANCDFCRDLDRNPTASETACESSLFFGEWNFPDSLSEPRLREYGTGSENR